MVIIPRVKKSEQCYDPIEDAMKCNPKLTREKAIEMAKDAGFLCSRSTPLILNF